MALADLFGGRTRAEALRLLATSSRPLSIYRIAKTIGAEPIQVSAVLRKLDGFVARTNDGWSLVNPALRQLLRDQYRLRPPDWKPNKAFLEATRSLEREPEKDRVLLKYGLRTADEARRL